MNITIDLLALVLLAGFGAWFWRRPQHGTAVIVALLPFERLGTLALGPTGHHLVRTSQLAAIALIGVAAVRMLTGRQKLRWPPLALVGFLAVAFVSAAIINNPRMWENYLALALVVLTLWAVTQTLTREGWALMRRWLFISAAAVCAFGLYQFLADIAGLPLWLSGLRPEYSSAVLGYPRIQSTELEPLYFANYLLLPLFYGLALALGQQLKRWEIGVLVLVGLVFGLTMSRGAFISSAAGLALLAAFALRHQRDALSKLAKPAAIALIIAILTLGLVGLASKTNRGQFASGPRLFIELLTTKLTNTGSFFERQAGQIGALDVIKHSPVFGVGPGRFETLLTYYPPRRFGYDAIFVNNTALAIACETGLLGLAFWLWYVLGLFGRALTRLWHHHDIRLLALASAGLAMLLQSFTFYGVFLTQLWVVLALLAAVPEMKKSE